MQTLPHFNTLCLPTENHLERGLLSCAIMVMDKGLAYMAKADPDPAVLELNGRHSPYQFARVCS